MKRWTWLVAALAMCMTPHGTEGAMPRDDSLSRRVEAAQRRKLKNLSETDWLPGAHASTGGPVDDDTSGGDGGDGGSDPGGGGGGGGTDPGGSGGGDCGGGLGGCEELAAAEVCLSSGSGAAEQQVGCVIDVIDAGLGPGDTVAWAADVKCTTANEVNDAGTLKKSASGLLLRDPLDTLDNVTIENGTAEILNGKMSLPAGDNDVRFTGISARSSLVTQVRMQGGSYPWVSPSLVNRCTSGLDGYGAQAASITDILQTITGGATAGTLDSAPRSAGNYRVATERVAIKMYVADDVQKAKIGTALDQAYDLTATDATHNGQTGTAGVVSPSTDSKSASLWFDLIHCTGDEITCSGLPTDYSIRVGSLSASESSGTATLDLEGTLYPSSFPLEVLDDSDEVVDAWTPPSGIFGGDTFAYSSTGSFSPDDATGQIDLDIFDSTGSLLETATTGQTTSQPSYRRLAGTVGLPTSSRFLAPTLRRAGTATAVVCSRRVTVRAGQIAPWVPCEDAAAPSAANRCGGLPIVRNSEWAFTSPGYGDYWGTHTGSSGEADAESPTLAQIDFIFDNNNEHVFLYQVDSSSQDLSKGIEPVRYVPVCPDDFIVFAAEFVKENPSDGTGWDLIIREYDANKEQVGSAHSGLLQWVSSEDGGRKQLTYWVGQELDDEDKITVRYLSLSFDADGDAGERSGMNYLLGWRNARDHGLSVKLSISGSNADLDWRAELPTRLRYVVNTTGFVLEDEVETSGTWENSNLDHAGSATSIIGSLSSGNVVYFSGVPYDRDYRRNGKIVHQMIIVP